jgi:hypothetical protein
MTLTKKLSGKKIFLYLEKFRFKEKERITG